MNGSHRLGRLFLIPTPLADNEGVDFPPGTIEAIHQLRHFIVEKAKTARRFVSKTNHPLEIRSLEFNEIPKHSQVDAYALLKSCRAGHDTGLMSEAGAPCVADPGAVIVRVAHELDIEVIPLVGPSALLLALMASGLNGQKFAFLGYLPANKSQLAGQLKKLEQRSARFRETLMFIETPYRNTQVVEQSLAILRSDTLLSIAVDLSAPRSQWIKTKTIGQWKRSKLPDLYKRPAVFSILATRKSG